MITQLFVSAGRYLLVRCKKCGGEFSCVGRIVFLSAMFLLIIAAHAFPPPLKALGPWKGQVVDAETKQPLEGVTVTAGWHRHWPDFDGLPTFGYVASEQVVTDKEGKFTIKAPRFIRSDPTVLEEPEFHFFKVGYERWRFQGEEGPLRLDVRERKSPHQEAKRQSQDKGIVIELVPRKVLAEHLMSNGNPDRIPTAPRETLGSRDDIECVHLDKENWRDRLIPWVPDDDEPIHCPSDQTKH
jgi:hypothetical protein